MIALRRHIGRFYETDVIAGMSEAKPLARRNIVLYLDGFEGITKHPLLQFAIRQREAVMLSLVFGPGINLKTLQIDIRSFCIKENSPARRAVTATNSLILVDLMEELRRLCWIDNILQSDEDRPLIRGRFLKHGGLDPVIPSAEVHCRIRQLKQSSQKQTCTGPNAGESKSCMNICVRRSKSPSATIPCRTCWMLAANRASAPISSSLWPGNSFSTARRMSTVGDEKPRFSTASRMPFSVVSENRIARCGI
jgi:hypothetical protein